jgi:hypothetical protein
MLHFTFSEKLINISEILHLTIDIFSEHSTFFTIYFGIWTNKIQHLYNQDSTISIFLVFFTEHESCWVMIQILSPKRKTDFWRSEAEARRREAWAPRYGTGHKYPLGFSIGDRFILFL